MGQPEAFIHLYPNLVTPQGDITDEETRRFLERYMDQFDDWAKRFTETPKGVPGIQ